MDTYNNYYQEVEEKAPNIFTQFAYAFIPPKYRQLAKVKTGSMIGFVTLMVLVFSILSFAVVSFRLFADGGLIEEFVDEIPDFSIRNGKLSIAETYYFNEDEYFVLITDEVSYFTMSDMQGLVDEGYESIILISETGISAYNSGQYRDFPFKDFKDLSLDKDWIEEKVVPFILGCVIVGYVFAFLFGTLLYFGFAAIYLLIAMLIASIMGKQIPSGKLYRDAVYSKVFMYVIASVLNSLPFHTPSIPFWVRVGLTTVFLGFAIHFTAEPDQPVNTPTYGGYIQ